MAIDGQSHTASEVPGATRTVADVDLRSPSFPPADVPRGALLEQALDRLRQTVRPDDRICPYSVTHIAVEFGPQAASVSPVHLGKRLARAVGEPAIDDDRPGGRQPLTHAWRTPHPTADPTPTVVTVERTFHEAGAPVSPGMPGPRSVDPPAGTHSVRRPVSPRRRLRAVVRYSPERTSGRTTVPPPAPTPACSGTLLVVDPDPAAEGEPGLAAVAASAEAERLGFVTDTQARCSDEALIAEVDGRPLDLVVLTVGAEPATADDYGRSTWSVPARLAEAYRSKGIDVLALSAGASLAAMAATVECGARAAYDLPGLRETLAEAAAPGGPGVCDGDRSGLPPKGADRLRLLTSAERRVLFALTTGRSPQAIAEDLVVSLATVRSHIRSVLRKLGVRSQLAAVALATSRALPTDTSSDDPLSVVGVADDDSAAHGA